MNILKPGNIVLDRPYLTVADIEFVNKVTKPREYGFHVTFFYDISASNPRKMIRSLEDSEDLIIYTNIFREEDDVE
jgi:hypothetical protein